MSPLDAALLHLETPTNRMQIAAVLLFDEQLDWQQLRSIVHQRLLHLYPRFKMRPDRTRRLIGFTKWEVDPAFDLNNHISHITLGDGDPQTQLEAFVSAALSSPLDMSQPLWQLTCVDGYKSGSALVVRMHHALADGGALIRVLLNLTDSSPDAAPSRAPSKIKSNQAKTNLIRQASSHIGDVFKTLYKYLFAPRDGQTLLQGQLGMTKAVAWSNTFSLGKVKAFGRMHNATINDVLVSVVSTALNHYLLARDGKAKALQAVIPVDLRPLNDTDSLGNKFGLVYLPLPTGINNQWERLRQVKARMDALKHSAEPILSNALFNLTGLLPLPLKVPILHFSGNKNSLVLSNVPGPRNPIYMAGSKLNSLMFWPPQISCVGLGISIISYNGGVAMGVLSDSNLIPDPHELIAYFEEALTNLLRSSLDIPRPIGQPFTAISIPYTI